MEKVLLVLFFVIPICALIVLFLVRAEQLMREDEERSRETREARELGGLSRWELMETTAQAMRTDARLAKLRGGKRRGGCCR